MRGSRHGLCPWSGAVGIADWQFLYARSTLTCNSKVKIPSGDGIFTLERAGGVEPPSAAWKAAIIAAIRCPLVGTVY